MSDFKNYEAFVDLIQREDLGLRKKVVERFLNHFGNFLDYPNSIYNVDFKEFSSSFSELCDYLHGSLFDDVPREDELKYPSLSEERYKFLDSYIQILALKKRLPKLEKELGSDNAFFKNISNFFNVVEPVANYVKDLKKSGNIKKGRKVSENAKNSVPENPNKVVMTCPCCFRQIAVRNGVMVNHGYRRPGWGFITSGCLCVGHKPLEKSDEGLKFVIKNLEKNIADTKAELEKKDSWTSISNRNFRGTLVTVNKGDKNWDRVLSRKIRELEWTIESLERDLETYKKELSVWSTKWKK